MELTHTDRFIMAKEYFYNKCGIILREDQKKAFQTHSSTILNEYNPGKGFTFSDNGEKTMLLSHLVVIAMVSLDVKIEVIVENKVLQEDFFHLTRKNLDYFRESEIFGFRVYMISWFNQLVIEQNKTKTRTGLTITVKEMEHTNEVFLRAKDYFYRHSAITLKFEQEKQFSIVLTRMVESLKSDKTIELDDDTTFNLPRRGGKTFCLSHLVAIGMVSLKAQFRVVVSNTILQKSFFHLVEKYLQVFQESDEFGYQITMHHFPHGITLKSNKNDLESCLDILVQEKPQKLTQLESKFKEIQNLSPQFREIASILLGFVHSQSSPFSLKEGDGLLKISLSEELQLIVTPNYSDYMITFKSFITQSFNYPQQIGEIVSSLHQFQNKDEKPESMEGLEDNTKSFIIMGSLAKAYLEYMEKS